VHYQLMTDRKLCRLCLHRCQAPFHSRDRQRYRAANQLYPITSFSIIGSWHTYHKSVTVILVPVICHNNNIESYMSDDELQLQTRSRYPQQRAPCQDVIAECRLVQTDKDNWTHKQHLRWSHWSSTDQRTVLAHTTLNSCFCCEELVDRPTFCNKQATHSDLFLVSFCLCY